MSIFCTSFPPDLRPAGPPGMEIWSNPLILNLSQFQEADRHGTGSQRSLSETGRAGRDLAADPKTGGELFFKYFTAINSTNSGVGKPASAPT